MRDNEIIEKIKDVFYTEIESLNIQKNSIDDSFVKAIRIISETKGKVILTGIGKSGLVARKISSTLSSTGTPSVFVHIGEAAHGDLGIIDKNDVVIALSFSGETKEVLTILPVIKRIGIPLISLTGNENSTLSKYSEVHLKINVSKEACPLGLAPTSSTSVMLVTGDALAVALMLIKDFSNEDFAFFHPGGALGKKLLVKVEDLMHTGEEIPFVLEKDLMSKIIFEISSKRLGIAGVIDKNMKLLGCITDGDLRRAMEKLGDKLFQVTAKDVMSNSPKTVYSNALAVKALKIMEDNSITVLFVVDENSNKVKGVIHIHDILKEGIS